MISGERDVLGQWGRPLVSVWFAVFAVLSVFFVWLVLHVDRSWTTADWLINYQGGFLRRGLAGECILRVHRLTGVPMNWVLGGLLAALQALLLASWYRLVRRSSMSAWVLAVLLSPAGLSFAVLDFEGGFRKELLLLAGVSATVAFLPDVAIPDWVLSLAISAFAACAVLVHEAAAFFFVYVFAALRVCGLSGRRALRVCVVPALVVVAGALLSFRFKGSLGTAEQICRSLGYTLNQSAPGEVCEYGAVWYLTFSGAHAFRETMESVRVNHAVRLYSMAAGLSLLPLVLGTVALAGRGLRRLLVVCWTCAGVCFCGSLLLFAFAVDWGRWIHIHAMLLGCLLLALDGRTGERTGSEQRWSYGWGARTAVLAGVFVYAVSWMLPLTYNSQPLRGYYGTAQQIWLAVRGAW